MWLYLCDTSKCYKTYDIRGFKFITKHSSIKTSFLRSWRFDSSKLKGTNNTKYKTLEML